MRVVIRFLPGMAENWKEEYSMKRKFTTKPSVETAVV